MRIHRRFLPAAIAGISAALLVAAPAAAAPPPPSTSPVGADLLTIVADRPDEKPDFYRTIDGVKEPVYFVDDGDTLHVPIRVINTGVTTYWMYGTHFITVGADVFDTPGKPVREGDYADSSWSTAIGAPLEEGIGYPYTRRTISIGENIIPGSNSRFVWPVTVDAMPDDGEFHAVQFRSHATVSDPELESDVTGKRIWLIHEK